ncbi:MAG: hypothetical protein HYW77_01290 [Parcubacteria group bacterium]|nr:hypothetical protein [Parcubacteria group bacterium]
MLESEKVKEEKKPAYILQLKLPSHNIFGKYSEGESMSEDPPTDDGDAKVKAEIMYRRIKRRDNYIGYRVLRIIDSFTEPRLKDLKNKEPKQFR